MDFIESDNIPRSGRALRPMRSFKAALLPARNGGQRGLLKTFSTHPWWLRCWGRLEIRREARAYAALQGLPFIPSPARRVDATTLWLEWIDAGELIHHPNRFVDAERIASELERAIEAMHERGVVHLDLGGRHNLLVDSAGTLRLVDFAGAWCFDPKGVAGRWILPLLRRVDQSALIKWRRTLLLPVSRSEWRRSSRRRQVSRWWWLNRKQP